MEDVRKSKVKKIVIPIIVVVIILGITAGIIFMSQNTLTAKIERVTREEILNKISVTYDAEVIPPIEITRIDIDDEKSQAKVYGKVTARDKYGYDYVGSFDVKVLIDINENVMVYSRDTNIETPTRWKFK